MMHKALHSRSDINRLYVLRKERRGRRGGGGLVSIEGCLDTTIQRLEKNTKKSKERLFTVVRNRKGNKLENKQENNKI